MKNVNVTISSTAGQGKSTIALIIEKALTEAGIEYNYGEDDIEMLERDLTFIHRTAKNLEEDKIKDYGINVNLSTKQLKRDCIKE